MASNQYEEIEDRIDAALASIDAEEKPNIAALARKFEVPESRLRARFHGRGNKFNNGGTNKRLSEPQEAALCQLIDREEAHGTYLRQWQLQNRANWILAQEHTLDSDTPPPTVGKSWVARFLRRFPQYKARRSNPLATARKWSHDPDRLQLWYERFRKAVQEFGIQLKDIYNFDETGFRVGVGGKQTLITQFSQEKLFHEDSDDREHLTSVETISADGYALPPFVILKGKIHLEKFYFEGGFSPDTTIGLSESGYMNEELSIPFLEHFDRYTTKRREGRWRMLVFDGFSTHTSQEANDFCWKHHIGPFALPPHATHLLQPLDVVCFQPLKHYHRQAIDEALRLGVFNFNRLEFISAFEEMRRKAFTASTILSSWKAAGLIPFNPDRVIAPLRKKLGHSRVQEEERPSTASSAASASTTSTWPTPKKLSDLHQYADYLKEISFEDEQVDRRYRRFVKGALAKAISGTEAEETLEMHKKRAALSAKLKEGTRKVVAKGGILNAGFAMAHIEKRRIKEVEGARIHARAQELPRNKRGAFKRQLAAIAKFDSLERPTKRTKRADSI